MGRSVIRYKIDLGELGERDTTVDFTFFPGIAPIIHIHSVIDDRTNVDLIRLLNGATFTHIEDQILEEWWPK